MQWCWLRGNDIWGFDFALDFSEGIAVQDFELSFYNSAGTSNMFQAFWH